MLLKPIMGPRVLIILELQQTGSVVQFHTQFMTLANRVVGLSDEALLDYFISGLKPNIKKDVLAREPNSLPRAVALAKLYDEGGSGFPHGSKPKFHSSPSTSLSVSATPPGFHAKSSHPPLLTTPPSKPSPMVRRLTPAEMQLRREKGLCYNCDEKFSATHKCPNKQFMMLIMDSEEEADNLEAPVPETEPKEESLILHHLSLQASLGVCGSCSIRFQGQVKGVDVSVLLDGGSSDNFIQPQLVQQLCFQVEAAPGFRVLVGNGHNMLGEGILRAIPLCIGGHELLIDAFVVDIKGADIVLGASWLATLGAHVADYSTASLQIFRDGRFITLQGFQDCAPKEIHYNHMMRSVITDGFIQLFVLEYFAAEVQLDSSVVFPVELPSDIVVLLKHFAGVFEQPTGLPPIRSHDHSITLLEGVSSVKVRPYRYPFSQKNQIEAMVQEMLSAGIIQPSTSPFSAPVLLVKKKVLKS